MVVENTTGMKELYEGNIFSAIFEAYNVTFGGFFIVMLFFAIHILIFLKTKNVILPLITGFIFISLYWGGSLALTGNVNPVGINIMYATIAFETIGVIFVMVWKRINGGF